MSDHKPMTEEEIVAATELCDGLDPEIEWDGECNALIADSCSRFDESEAAFLKGAVVGWPRALTEVRRLKIECRQTDGTCATLYDRANNEYSRAEIAIAEVQEFRLNFVHHTIRDDIAEDRDVQKTRLESAEAKLLEAQEENQQLRTAIPFPGMRATNLKRLADDIAKIPLGRAAFIEVSLLADHLTRLNKLLENK